MSKAYVHGACGHHLGHKYLICVSCGFLSSYFMSTFEEAFYTGFFTLKMKIFGPEIADLRARFVAYHAMELQSTLHDQISAVQDVEAAKKYIAGLQMLTRHQALR